MDKEDVKLLCRLYREAKYKDEQIKILSEIFLITTVQVEQILQANGLHGGDKSKLYAKFSKLYNTGKTDYQIAMECRQTTIQVKDWRILNNLKPNTYREGV